jgi:hypothetical protein
VKLPHRISGESNALLRIGMVHMLSGAIPLYIVNEYPKSGGTWVGQMLGRALRVPFPRNRFPVLRPSIMHGHYLRPWGMKNVVVVWRDGRDVDGLLVLPEPVLARMAQRPSGREGPQLQRIVLELTGHIYAPRRRAR